nr:mucin-3B-like [Zootoca vivipara]
MSISSTTEQPSTKQLSSRSTMSASSSVLTSETTTTTSETTTPISSITPFTSSSEQSETTAAMISASTNTTIDYSRTPEGSSSLLTTSTTYHGSASTEIAPSGTSHLSTSLERSTETFTTVVAQITSNTTLSSASITETITTHSTTSISEMTPTLLPTTLTPFAYTTTKISTAKASSPSTTTRGRTSTNSQLRTSSASSTTVAPLGCLNGGVLVEGRCHCPSPYIGQRCEEAKNEVQVVTVEATINVSVTVKNRMFSPEMVNSSSSAFKTFVKIFEEQMNILYADIPGYTGVKVIRLSNGSVIVDHEVLLQLHFSDFNASYNASMKNLTQTLQNNCTSNDRDQLCFTEGASRVTAVPLSPEDLSDECKNVSVVAHNLQPYYVAQVINNTLQCVSNCSAWNPHPFHCVNGKCHITSEGPQCQGTPSTTSETSISTNLKTTPSVYGTTTPSAYTSTKIYTAKESPPSTTTRGRTSTSSQPTSSSAPSTTAVPLTCLNGGVLVGGRCQCPPPYTGRRCEEAENEVQVVTVEATINVSVTVKNWKFSPEMVNPSSSAFKTFVKIFVEQMNIFYVDVPGYMGVKVIRLSNGSVIVDHEVLLQLHFSDFNASYDESMKDLKQTLKKNYTSNGNDSLWFTGERNVTAVPLSPEDLSSVCKNSSVVAQNIQQFYMARNVSGDLQCVSNCSVWHPDPFSCVNGNCYVTPGGPSCYCEQSESYWFVGHRCEQGISKVGVAVGVALGLAALLLIILVLAVLLCWRRCCRSEKGHRLMHLPPDEERWYENEPDWVARPEGPDPSAPAMESSSSAAGEDPYSSMSSEQDSSTTDKGSFQPRLDKVDTSLPRRIARPQLKRP